MRLPNREMAVRRILIIAKILEMSSVFAGEMEAIPLDDLENIPRLKEIAEQVDLTETITWLEQHFADNGDD